MTPFFIEIYTERALVFGVPRGWDDVLVFITQPDNIPIVLMGGAMVVFTWLSFRETRRSSDRSESPE